MDKVYVVTSGSYSDYGIERIFSTQELAEKYIRRRYGMCRDAEIEEHSLDHPDGCTRWKITMNRDGSLDGESRHGGAESWGSSQYGTEHCLARSWSKTTHEPGEIVLIVSTSSARDQQHAIKIANEIRTQLIAENKWEGDK
jgi:hypothetical protein